MCRQGQGGRGDLHELPPYRDGRDGLLLRQVNKCYINKITNKFQHRICNVCPTGEKYGHGVSLAKVEKEENLE